MLAYTIIYIIIALTEVVKLHGLRARWQEICIEYENYIRIDNK